MATQPQDATRTEEEAGNQTAKLEDSNACAVRAKNIKTGEYKVIKTFYDFRHTSARDFAAELRDRYKTLPLKFEVAQGFYKCWSCGDHSTDKRFLTENAEGERVCRRCYHAPELPRDVWCGERLPEGEKLKRSDGGSR